MGGGGGEERKKTGKMDARNTCKSDAVVRFPYLALNVTSSTYWCAVC